MSNILLITDVARLRNVFGRLADDSTVHLKIVNNLENGGEEIADNKPDFVFVQTYLSGLSAEILIMHLKKQLGDNLSHFILLAAPNQVNDSILAPFQGWLDTSLEDDQLLSSLRTQLHLLSSNESKSKGEIFALQQLSSVDQPVNTQSANVEANAQVPAANNTVPPEPVTAAKAESPSDTAVKTINEDIPQDKGNSYPPRARLSVYSEFNSSFDNAVTSTPEPESVEQSASAQHDSWLSENMETFKTAPPRSKRLTFLMWLTPVVIVVIVLTILQHRVSQQATSLPSTKSGSAPNPEKNPAAVFTSQSSAALLKPLLKPMSSGRIIQPNMAVDPSAQTNDKAVIMAITENREQKRNGGSSTIIARPARLPDFIPHENIDKTYSVSNPGWERYTSKEAEYRVYREKANIKAIQVIALGDTTISNAFLNNVYNHLDKTAIFIPESTETKEGYKIERGHIADNLKVVYYRDEKDRKMRAFVLTWM